MLSAFISASAQTAKKSMFNHLDASVTLGTTGIGFDLSMPVVENWVDVRVGGAFMPHFNHNMSFGVQVGDDPSTSNSKFNRLSDMLEDFTGTRVDDRIDMKGTPLLSNFKLMVDVYPFRNKHWHLTAGFYLGNSDIAEAVNIQEDMPSLFAIKMYNHMYDKFAHYQRDEQGYLPDEFYNLSIFSIGSYKINDPDALEAMYDKLTSSGRMGIHVGDYSHDVVDAMGNIVHRKGDAYRMEPDDNSMVSARASVNKFKPYLGFGYGGRLIKGNDNWKVSFDAGVMFWGGKPSIMTHDGTDLVNDVENISGKVGDYIKVIKKFSVYPVLNVRITRRIF